MIVDVKDTSQVHDIVQSTTMSVIDCYADWCGPCKVLAQSLHAIAAKYPSVNFYKANVETLDLVKVDVDGKSIPISSLPTVIITKSGKLVELVIGANVAKIEAALQKDI